MDLGYFVKLRGADRSYLYQVAQGQRGDFESRVTGLANETLAKMKSESSDEKFKIEILTAETVAYVQSLHNLLNDMLVDPNMPKEWVLDIQATLKA